MVEQEMIFIEKVEKNYKNGIIKIQMLEKKI